MNGLLRSIQADMRCLSYKNRKVFMMDASGRMSVSTSLLVVVVSLSVGCTGLLLPSASCFVSSHHAHTTTAFLPTRRSSTTTNPSPHTALNMALVPMRVSELSDVLVLGVPTGEQWGSYWGRTSTQRYNAAFESVSVSFLGLFASYFVSFVIGSPLATLSGTVALFWSLLGPEWRAYQRNWELRGGRELVDEYADYDDDDEEGRTKEDEDGFWDGDASGGLYGAYYFGSVRQVGVVEDAHSSHVWPLADFDDYTMEADDDDPFHFPYQLRLLVQDQHGRALQVHARLAEEYLDIRPGMPLAAVLLSTERDFTTLDSLTDFFIPDANCWVGDYPYLNRDCFCRLLTRNKTWRLLEQERLVMDTASQPNTHRNNE